MNSGTFETAPAALRGRSGRLLSCAIVFIAASTCVARLIELHAQAGTYPSFMFDCVAACLTALACIAVIWFLGESRPRISSCVVGAGLGLLFFDYTLGFALVDPRNIDWLLRGDWAQHFLGWHFYRKSPWVWPPGKFDSFWYPVGTAIVFTDSLPLFALPLKVFSAWLPDRFQYVGIWMLCSCALQGTFGMLLVRRFFPTLAIQMLGASLLLLAPVFISRIDHDTLTAQWILLAAFCIYFGADPIARKTSMAWLALATIAALVHPYLSAMLLGLSAAYYVSCILAGRITFVQAAVRMMALLAATLFCWWLSGAFTLRPSAGGVSLGIYNSNLLTWIDSQWMSRWLPALPNAGDGQYDGRGYLGLGVIAILCTCAVFALRRTASATLASSKASGPIWPLIAVAGAAALYAFGTRFTFGSTVLLDLTPAHASILGAFRGSGRFIWLSTYLITFSSFVFAVRRGGKLGILLVALAVALQVADLSPLYDRSQHLRELKPPPAFVLSDSVWADSLSGRRHITLLPPPACGVEAAPYLPFSLLAADHGMTINTGYLARFDEQKTFAYCDVLREQIAAGKREPDTLYIVGREQLASFKEKSDASMRCLELEGYTACATIRP